MRNLFPSLTLSPSGGSSLLAPSPESPQSIRGGYVPISPSTTASTLHSDSKDINPAIYAATIGRQEPYNLYHMENFNPGLFHTQTVARLGPIPFVDGYFDGTASFSMSGNYHTTCFQLHNEYNTSYHPSPFTGTYPRNYVEAAMHYTTQFHDNLTQYLKEMMNDTETTKDSKLLLRYPPSIYFGRTPVYELWVFRAHIDYLRLLPKLRRFRTDAYNLLHTIHAVLTPQQAAECQEDEVYILLLDGTTCTPAYIHRGEFLQQRAPTANPLFTLEEAGFLRSACGLLRFYGKTELAEVVDLILQTPLPDEDVVTQLLHEFHLKDPTSFAGSHTGT